MYLSAICTWKCYQNEKMIICHSISEVKDSNAVTRHILYTILNEEYRVKGSLPPKEDLKRKEGTSEYHNSFDDQNFKASNGGLQSSFGDGFGTGYPSGGFLSNSGGSTDTEENMVIQKLRQISRNRGKNGFNLQDIQVALSTGNPYKVDTTIKSLENRGIILRNGENEFMFV